jgi:hypothetical protein
VIAVRYGPLSDQVVRLVASTDRLTPERISLIAEAYLRAGRPIATFSEVAAKRAGRWQEVHAARKEMALSVVAFGLTTGAEWEAIKLASDAAGNAGIGLATEDLIWTMGYTGREYEQLVKPWFAGYPLNEGEL